MTRISINSLCNPDSPSVNEFDQSQQDIPANQLDNQAASRQGYTGNHFIDRVSSLPVVGTALRAYEQTKANNSVVKYGAETVENSVKSICRPVISKIEPQLAGLDEFACRQLDRIQSHYSSYMEPTNNADPSNDLSEANRLEDPSAVSYSYNNNQDDSNLRQRHAANYSSPNDEPQQNVYQTQVVETQQPTRSRWQQVVHEAGVTAGAGVALFSDESMKMLKYCLEWLQYSSNHIQEQLNLLNNYLVSILPQSRSNEVQTYQATRFFVSAIKKEVVTTLKKIVDILSLYAGNCLPGDARNMVKNFILGLPSRWAALNTAVGTQPHSVADCDTPTPCSSPLLTPIANSPQIQSQKDQTQGVITLATESLNMINNVTDVFKQTVERAEGWMSAVGMQPAELPPLSLPSQHPGYSATSDFSNYHMSPNSNSSNPANLASFSLSSQQLGSTASNRDAMDTTD